MKTHLVTGATGFVGIRLLGLLKNLECEVRLLSRSRLPGYESIFCYFKKDKIPLSALQSIDTVFHLAGFAHDLHVNSETENLYQIVNVDATVQLAGAFEFKDSLTPKVSGVSPDKGGTGGGTEITITGTGFTAGATASIGGSPCIVSSTTGTTEIVCITEPHVGSGEFPVLVKLSGGNSIAETPGSDSFQYVDRWSSVWTWGGGPVPQEGEFIVLEKGQNIVLDVSTPRLSFLLLNGGNLIWDKEADGLQLNTEFILIMEPKLLTLSTYPIS